MATRSNTMSRDNNLRTRDQGTIIVYWDWRQRMQIAISVKDNIPHDLVWNQWYGISVRNKISLFLFTPVVVKCNHYIPKQHWISNLTLLRLDWLSYKTLMSVLYDGVQMNQWATRSTQGLVSYHSYQWDLKQTHKAKLHSHRKAVISTHSEMRHYTLK